MTGEMKNCNITNSKLAQTSKLPEIPVLPIEIDFDFSKTKDCAECGHSGFVFPIGACRACEADLGLARLTEYHRKLQPLIAFSQRKDLDSAVMGSVLLLVGEFRRRIEVMENDGLIPIGLNNDAMIAAIES